MANRSFVYTTNALSQALGASTGLSEFDYDVHPLYMLLVAYDTQAWVFSFAEEPVETALVGDFAKGRQAVLQFLALLVAYDESFQHAAFEEFVEESAAVLLARQDAYVVLETADLDGAFEPGFLASILEATASYRAEVEALHQQHIARTLTAKKLFATSIYSDFEDAGNPLGTSDPEDIEWENFWSDTLYYSLEDE